MTIKKTFFNRLKAQKLEADVQGLNSVSSALERQLKKYATKQREDSAPHIYEYNDMVHDVKNMLWDAAIKVADFSGIGLDAKETDELIERQALDFISELNIKIGSHGVGEYESPVPGERVKYSSALQVYSDIEDQDG